MNLNQLGEFGLIERIRRRVRTGDDVVLGIGDDCAATELPPEEQLLTTTDMLLEDVHFNRAWTDMLRLGRKSVSVNVSDIAAMGGTPRHLFVGLGIPPDLSVEDLDALSEGMLQASQDYGVTLIGGDTCRSRQGLVISVTLQGSVPRGKLLCRSGAQDGDLIGVSGTLGDSALALRDLLKGETSDPWLLQRHHDPQARVPLGMALAKGQLATAMIDISDGLHADLSHVLQGSGVGARIDLSALPLSEPFRQRCATDGTLIDLALGGGEDYELLFTVPPGAWARVEDLSHQLHLPITCIGHIRCEEGLAVLTESGEAYLVKTTGFNHFSRPSGSRSSGR